MRALAGYLTASIAAFACHGEQGARERSAPVEWDGSSARILPVDMSVTASRATAVGGELVALNISSEAGSSVFTITARGTACESSDGQKAPSLVLLIDEKEAQHWVLDGTSFLDRSSSPIPLAAGRHRISIRFTNDLYRAPDCDRNAWISRLRIEPQR